MNESIQLSAEIILVSETGKVITENTLITTENLDDYMPSEETIIQVTRFFDNEGFETYPVVGISLTIYGIIEIFSRLFSAQIEFSESEGAKVLNESGEHGRILPLNNLPTEIADLIQIATFTEPPEYHASEFYF